MDAETCTDLYLIYLIVLLTLAAALNLPAAPLNPTFEEQNPPFGIGLLEEKKENQDRELWLQRLAAAASGAACLWASPAVRNVSGRCR